MCAQGRHTGTSGSSSTTQRGTRRKLVARSASRIVPRKLPVWHCELHTCAQRVVGLISNFASTAEHTSSTTALAMCVSCSMPTFLLTVVKRWTMVSYRNISHCVHCRSHVARPSNRGTRNTNVLLNTRFKYLHDACCRWCVWFLQALMWQCMHGGCNLLQPSKLRLHMNARPHGCSGLTFFSLFPTDHDLSTNNRQSLRMCKM